MARDVLVRREKRLDAPERSAGLAKCFVGASGQAGGDTVGCVFLELPPDKLLRGEDAVVYHKAWCMVQDRQEAIQVPGAHHVILDVREIDRMGFRARQGLVHLRVVCLRLKDHLLPIRRLHGLHPLRVVLDVPAEGVHQIPDPPRDRVHEVKDVATGRISERLLLLRAVGRDVVHRHGRQAHVRHHVMRNPVGAERVEVAGLVEVHCIIQGALELERQLVLEPPDFGQLSVLDQQA
eukprot:scaffold7963_cov286-Pinguiococcus_pyrenoidosus.AAC.2